MFEIGATLRKARRRAALELRDVESATMIPARFLAALEQERFEQLPAGLYRRSFLREYAEFLGLRGDAFVDEYELRFAPGLSAPDDPAGQAPSSDESDLGRPPRGALRAALSPGRMVMVALVVLAGVGVWLLGGSTTRGGTQQRALRVPPVVRSSTLPPTQQAATGTSRPTAAALTRSKSAPVLTLSAVRGDCWLLVRTGSSRGSLVYDHTLRRGQLVRFGLDKRLWIRLGAPWNLTGTIDQRPAGLPATTGDIVATSAGIAAAQPPTPATAPLLPTSDAVQLNTRGYELMLTGNYRAALPLLQRAAAGLNDPADPVTAYANFNLGQTLVRLDRCSDAIPYLEHAAQLEPSSLEVQDALAYAHRCST